MPHEIKGQGIYAYVTLNAGVDPSEELRRELVRWVRQEIGPIASPDAVQFTPALPKTRSGKIMRRILRKIAEGDVSNLGDTSTLADPGVVDDLVTNRSEEHTSELQSLMRISYAVFCLKKKTNTIRDTQQSTILSIP